MRPLVIIESPYAGEVERNVAYARRCLMDSLMRGEAPFASHLLYTQVLDDNIPADRALGIGAGLEWRRVASFSAFYTDLGWSRGMIAAYKDILSWNTGNYPRNELRALDEKPTPCP